ncbi:MAG: DUF393 domain-containing protein [Pyrinomonadaceae bacterium]|nr:DUF393 domain-containing protein [Pyrinomonadaceae bacterium]
MKETKRIEVYTDGRCPLCQWTRARVEPWDAQRRIEWFDYNEPESLTRAAPHTLAELGDEMHVRLEDGGWRRGYEAWLEVVGVLPRWSWLKPVLSLAPFRRVGPVLYKWIARRRYKLFGAPPACDSQGACALHDKR